MRRLFLQTVTLLSILASLSSCKHDDVMDVNINDKGYKIARRTVAKYREMLDIPVARMRKQI